MHANKLKLTLGLKESFECSVNFISSHLLIHSRHVKTAVQHKHVSELILKNEMKMNTQAAVCKRQLSAGCCFVFDTEMSYGAIVLFNFWR